MKFCKYCGKQIPSGETCSCQKQEEEEVTEETLIDLGLTDDVVITTGSANEAKLIDIQEQPDKEYKYCSNCGKRILEGEICSCQEEEIVKETIVNDSVNALKEFLSTFFKAPSNAVVNYLKKDSFNTSLFILFIFLISTTLFQTLIFTSNSTIEIFGHLKVFATTMDIIIYALKNLISNILQVVFLTVTIMIFLRSKNVSIKDTFNASALSLLPIILFNVIAFPFGILKISIYSTITLIGYISSILIIDESIRNYFKVDENKVFITLISITSTVLILNNLLVLIIK